MALPGIVAATTAVGSAGAPVQEQVSAADEGARVWSGTCPRCHSRRQAPEFTAEQWPIIVNHMRTRADLTRSEAQAVAAFLQRLRASSSP